MLTGKQRSYLKGLSHGMNSSIQLGKDGLTQSILDELDELLEYKELIKISVLDNSPLEADEIVDDVIEYTDAEFVQLIGNKLIIYRESKDHKQIVLK